MKRIILILLSLIIAVPALLVSDVSYTPSKGVQIEVPEAKAGPGDGWWTRYHPNHPNPTRQWSASAWYNMSVWFSCSGPFQVRHESWRRNWYMRHYYPSLGWSTAWQQDIAATDRYTNSYLTGRLC